MAVVYAPESSGCRDLFESPAMIAHALSCEMCNPARLCVGLILTALCGVLAGQVPLSGNVICSGVMQIERNGQRAYTRFAFALPLLCLPGANGNIDDRFGHCCRDHIEGLPISGRELLIPCTRAVLLQGYLVHPPFTT